MKIRALWRQMEKMKSDHKSGRKNKIIESKAARNG
jgi:hypothetical protein